MTNLKGGYVKNDCWEIEQCSGVEEEAMKGKSGLAC